MSRRAVRLLFTALVPLGLVGCGLLMAPRTITPRYFVLNAVAPASGATSPIALGVGPISLPSYLDRPEMARRVDANQIAYDAAARWAEPLKSNFERALGADLVQLIGPARIVAFPWYANETVDVQVAVGVARFEQQPDGSLELSGRWTVRDGHGALVAAETFDYTRPGGSPDDNAAGLSALVADLSQVIAAAIR
jgi:hypothetical protein